MSMTFNMVSTAEIISAIYILIIYISLVSKRDKSLSMKRLRMLYVLAFVWLVSDTVAIVFTAPDFELSTSMYYLIHFFNLLSFTMSNIILTAFLFYCDAYLGEKTKISKWTFRIPIIIMLINTLLVVVWYLNGKVVIYQDGAFSAVGDAPVFSLISAFIMMFYAPIVASWKRHEIGEKPALLLSSFTIPVVVSIIILVLLDEDYSVILGSASVALATSLLQKDITQSRIEEDARHDALMENNTRVLALEDNFESLYDIELATGRYQSYVKGSFYQTNVHDKLVAENDYFEDLRANIDAVIYPDDRDGLYSALSKEVMIKELEKSNHFDYYYRINSDRRPIWLKLRVVYKDEKKRNVIVGVFNAEEEMIERRHNEQLRRELISKMTGGVSSYIVNPHTGRFQILGQNQYLAGKYHSDETYTESISRYIETDVFEPDRKMAREKLSLVAMRNYLDDEDEYVVQYRDISTGAPRWYEMRAVMLSDTEILYGFTDKDNEITNELIFNKLEDDYFAFFKVSLDVNLVKILKNNPNYHAVNVGEIRPYSTMMKALAAEFEGEDKEYFEKLSDIEYLKQRLDKEDKISYTYRSHVGEGITWGNVTVLVIARNNDNTPSLCAIGFSLLDEDANRLQNIQTQVKEDMKMIGGLASEYHALYYFDIEEGMYRVYSLDREKYPQAASIVSEGLSPIDAIRRFGQSDLVYPDDRHLFGEISVDYLMERLAHSKKFTVRFRRKYGDEYLWTEMDVIKYENVDEKPNVIVAGFAERDADIRKELEHSEELSRMNKQLESARVAAEVANESKTTFLFNMSHDIRTPMNAITGFTVMAKKYIDDKEKVKDYLEKIDISGQQLLSLINQVLEMARIESGRIELVEKPVDVRKEYNAMITVLNEQANANGIKFNHSLKEIGHNYVLADDVRLGQITLNVVSNAIKYTPAGGTIDMILEEIESDNPEMARYVLTVKDTGIGMSEEYQKRLFQPFERENSSTVSSIQGTGLGLSIVKKLVDILDGTIKVDSKLNEGTTFEITIDLRISNEIMENQGQDDIDISVFKGKRILVVEDNALNREIAKDLLEELGFTVEEADDGDVAVEMVEKAETKDGIPYYSAVLMDIQMPRMDGFEATRIIRSLPPLEEHVPIIAMTANAFEEDRQNSFNAGMDEHIAKPISIGILKEVLSRFVK